MLYHDLANRLRTRVAAGEMPSSFEGYFVRTVACRMETAADEAILWQMPGNPEPFHGPEKIFGEPADRTCLAGIGPFDLATGPTTLLRLEGAEIIGNNAVLCDGALYSPAPAANGDVLKRLRWENNYQGFVLTEREGTHFCTYACREAPRALSHHAVFFHNLERGNYGSFLLRQLPQMLLFRAAAAAAGLPAFDCYVVPERTPWFREALALVGLPERPVLSLEDVSGDRFVSVMLFGNCEAEGFLPAVATAELPRLIERCGANPRGRPGTDIYVSRRLLDIRRPNYRRLRNYDDVETLFAAAGFEIVTPEALSFAEQVRVFAAAGRIAGPSGSGMLNAVFAPADARVLDMESFSNNVRQHAKLYSSTRKPYAFAFGDVDAAGDRPLLTRNWTMPLPAAKEALAWLKA